MFLQQGTHTAPELSLGCRQRGTHVHLPAEAFHLQQPLPQPGARQGWHGEGAGKSYSEATGNHRALPDAGGRGCGATLTWGHVGTVSHTLQPGPAPAAGQAGQKPGAAAFPRPLRSLMHCRCLPCSGKTVHSSVWLPFCSYTRPCLPALPLSPRWAVLPAPMYKVSWQNHGVCVCLASAPGDMRREGKLVFGKEEEEYSNSAAGARDRLR